MIGRLGCLARRAFCATSPPAREPRRGTELIQSSCLRTGCGGCAGCEIRQIASKRGIRRPVEDSRSAPQGIWRFLRYVSNELAARTVIGYAALGRWFGETQSGKGAERRHVATIMSNCFTFTELQLNSAIRLSDVAGRTPRIRLTTSKMAGYTLWGKRRAVREDAIGGTQQATDCARNRRHRDRSGESRSRGLSFLNWGVRK